MSPVTTTDPVPQAAATDETAPEQVQADVVEQDVLVEDVSIDGMCGVY